MTCGSNVYLVHRLAFQNNGNWLLQHECSSPTVFLALNFAKNSPQIKQKKSADYLQTPAIIAHFFSIVLQSMKT